MSDNKDIREVNDRLKKIQNLSLSSTNPYFINDTALHEFGNRKGYVLYVIADAVLNVASSLEINGNSIIGITLPIGYYHIISSSIKLDSGSVIVYRSVN